MARSRLLLTSINQNHFIQFVHHELKLHFVISKDGSLPHSTRKFASQGLLTIKPVIKKKRVLSGQCRHLAYAFNNRLRAKHMHARLNIHA